MDLFKYSWNPLEDVQEPSAPVVESKGLFSPVSSREKIQEAETWRKQFKDMLSSYWGGDDALRSAIQSPDVGDLNKEESNIYEEWMNVGLGFFDSMDETTAEESTRQQADRMTDTADVTYEAPNQAGLMRRPAPELDMDVPEYKVYDSPNEMSDLEILARTIEAEAGVEGYDGKLAVGAVIANRAASGRHGKDIKGVILKKGQFSPWNSYTGYAKGEQGKDMLKLKPTKASYAAAQSILMGDYEDPTDGATHYVNPEISTPDWFGALKRSKRGTVAVGSHLFGNPDNAKKYDGKAWVTSRFEPVRPKLRPEDI